MNRMISEHPGDRPGRHRTEGPGGEEDVAAERAPLRRADRPQQGGDGRQARRGAGQDLAALLRRAPAQDGEGPPLLRHHRQ